MYVNGTIYMINEKCLKMPSEEKKDVSILNPGEWFIINSVLNKNQFMNLKNCYKIYVYKVIFFQKCCQKTLILLES